MRGAAMYYNLIRDLCTIWITQHDVDPAGLAHILRDIADAIDPSK